MLMVTVARDIIYCAVRSQGRQIYRNSVACRSNFQGDDDDEHEHVMDVDVGDGPAISNQTPSQKCWNY